MNGRAIIILFLMAGLVSADQVTLQFEDIFYECQTSQSIWECGAYFIIPNFHVKAFKELIWDNIFSLDVFFTSPDSQSYEEEVINQTTIEERILSDLNEGGFINTLREIFQTMTVDIPLGESQGIGIFDVVLNTISNIFQRIVNQFKSVLFGIIAYFILLSLEIVKNYVVFGMVFVAWNVMFISLGADRNMTPDPVGTAIIVVGLMVLGSFYLLSLNWGGVIPSVGF